MSQHTPGPWRVVRRRANGPLHVMSQAGLYVMDGSNQRESRIRNPADALLIAAAPDLLAELQKLNEKFGYVGKGWPDLDWDDARAAIAKATGEV